MSFDAHANLAISAAVNTPGLAGTTLTVASGDGPSFPAVPFNCTLWPAASVPVPSNAEIVRVTAISGDDFTIVRAQEGTTAKAITAGFQIANTATKKTFTDIENAFGFPGTQYGIPYFATVEQLASTGAGTAAQFLRGNASGAPSFSAIADGDLPSALTGKTYNGLTLAAAATGFTIAGGTTSKTLTVDSDLTTSAIPTGNVVYSGTQFGLPYFATTSTLGSTAAGTTNQVLIGAAAGAPSFTGSPSITAITLSSLTAGRVAIVGTAGLLTDSASLLFSSTSLTVGAAVLNGAAATTLTGGGGNMTITAGTGVSRSLTLQTTSGASAAQTNLTLNADLTSTFAGGVSGTTATLSSLTPTRVTFAGASGLLTDDADMTFVTDTLLVTKLLAPTSVSTPSLISTTALTITPAAGSNLNVSLATTGDFVVNTTQFCVDTSAAMIGIGIAAPLVKLHVLTAAANDANIFVGTSLAQAIGNTAELRFGLGSGFTANGTDHVRIYAYMTATASSLSDLRFDTYNAGRETALTLTAGGGATFLRGITLTGAQTITTSTGALTLATGAANGNILWSPHGTGRVVIQTGTYLSSGNNTLLFGDVSVDSDAQFSGLSTSTTVNGPANAGSSITLFNASNTNGNYTWIGALGSATNVITGIAFVADDAGGSTPSGSLQFWTRASGGSLAQRWGITAAGNLIGVAGLNAGIGTATFGTSATNTLALFNGTVPSTSPADTVQLFSVDITAGNASLGIRTERAVDAAVGIASTNSMRIKVNGSTYDVPLVFVA